MNTEQIRSSESVREAQGIYLGLDVHADQITVCRKFDGSVPQPAQRFTQAALLPWIRRQVEGGARVYSCYEAGPFGYGLDRELRSMGVVNLVVAPQDWDERGKRVKTDRRDARVLCQRLDRWVHGSRRVFSVVRVPTPEQEQRRALCRQRQFAVRACHQSASRGRSMLLTQGYRVKGHWWSVRNWAELRRTLPEPLRTHVELWQQTALRHDATQRILRTQIEALAGPEIPVGIGAMSWVIVCSEVLDWSRFSNRRTVGSYTGLCPCEHSSGGSRRQGSINRHGNPHLRHALVEMTWRLLLYQPNCMLFEKFPQLRDPKTDKRRRKRLIVAAARRLAIDLWRLNTGQTTTQALRLRVPPQKASATPANST